MRPVVFLWENLGPYHLDRLRAVEAGGRPVIGLQYAGTSTTYGWAAEPGEIDVRTLGATGGWRLAWCLWRACRRIGRADFFFCHYQHWPVLLAAAALRLTGARVMTMADSKFDDYPRRFWREVAKRVFLLPYAGALTAGPRSADYLRWLGVRRVALGYNSLSVERLRRVAGTPPAPDGLPFGERDWLVIARLVPKKNVQLAIGAYARWLAATDGPRELHLCGGGPLEPELRAQVAALGLDARVHFHGFVQAEVIARRLGAALALLLPSTEEQFGLVVVEAQALGLPVLVTPAAGALDELVEPGVNGFLLSPDDPQGWANAMAMLADDEARWRRLAEAAAASAPRGDVARFVAGVAALTG